MKRFFSLTKFSQLEEKGFFAFCCAGLAAIAISVYSWLFPPVMVIWCIVWIIGKNKEKIFVSRNVPGYNVLLTLFLSLYVLQIISLLYSKNIKNGFENIFMKLPLLILPFLLQNPGEMIKKNGKKILQIFALGVFSYIIICLVHAACQSVVLDNGIWKFKPFPESRYWENYFFSSGGFTMSVHPSYFAMYTLLAIFISFDAILDRSENSKYKSLWIVAVLFMIISLYMLSSRAGLLAIMLTVPVYFFKKIKKKLNFTLLLFSFLMLFLVLFSLLNRNSRFNYYAQKAKVSSLREILMLDERGNLWKSALSIIDKNLIFGVGIGDSKEELIKEYNNNTSVSKLSLSYNAHNQYLEVLLENGIIGLIFFLAIMVWIFYISIDQSLVLYMIFIIICMVFFLFESMLNRLAGISFFAFFSFLFLHLPSDKTKIVS